MDVCPYFQIKWPENPNYFCNVVSIIVNPLVSNLFAAFKARRKSVPDFEAETGIPRDRVYKWRRSGTTPKAEDQAIIEKWLQGGIMDKSPINQGNSAVQESGEPDLLKTLLTRLVTLTENQNRILERQEKDLVEKVNNIDTNLNLVTAQAESLKYDLESGRTVVLQSLARIEGKKPDELLHEADNIKFSLAVAKDELYKSSVLSTPHIVKRK